MKVLELFSGTECISNAFRARGHECFTIDWDEQFPSSWHTDISKVTAQDILDRFGKPDVVWCGTDCFVPGTLVWTNSGYKNIEDVECNDYVLTHKGNYKKVYATMKRSNTHMYNIKISGCEMITCTDNHPFYVRKKKRINTHRNGEVYTATELLEPEWVEAKDLDTEYRVGIPINTKSEIPKWNGVIRYTKNGYGITNSWIENKLEQYMDNEDFWWFVGRYIGDGYIDKPKEKKRKSYNGIDLCCSVDEINEIKPVLDRLPFNYTERIQHPICHFCIYDKELHEFLMQFGVGALNKNITPDILNLPVKLLKCFVDGYISADGHWDNSLQNPVCTMTTVSRKLAYGMQQCILKAYERHCSLVVNKKPNNVIEGRQVNTHISYIIGFYRDKTNRLQYTIEDGMTWVNIRKVEKLPTKQTSTYNISVEDDESYTVYNVAVHNCTSYSVAAISKHRRKNPETGNLDPVSDYAKFCDNMNIHVKELIKELNPKLYFWENPRAGLRKMDFMQDMPRYTITYCQYMMNEPWERRRMKPTDLWTNHPNPKFKPACKNGAPCHPPAPRSSNRYGTQALKNSVERSKYPDELCEHIVNISEEYMENLHDKT